MCRLAGILQAGVEVPGSYKAGQTAHPNVADTPITSRRRKVMRRGFTLIELLVVIAII